MTVKEVVTVDKNSGDIIDIDNQICETLNRENKELKTKNNELSRENELLKNEVRDLKNAAKFTRIATAYLSSLRCLDFYDIDDDGSNIVSESNLSDLLIDFQKFVFDNSWTIEGRQI